MAVFLNTQMSTQIYKAHEYTRKNGTIKEKSKYPKTYPKEIEVYNLKKIKNDHYEHVRWVHKNDLWTNKNINKKKILKNIEIAELENNN